MKQKQISASSAKRLHRIVDVDGEPMADAVIEQQGIMIPGPNGGMGQPFWRDARPAVALPCNFSPAQKTS